MMEKWLIYIDSSIVFSLYKQTNVDTIYLNEKANSWIFVYNIKYDIINNGSNLEKNNTKKVLIFYKNL